MKRGSITAADVQQTPARHMLAGGYDIVLGLEKGRSRRLWDAQRRRSIRPADRGCRVAAQPATRTKIRGLR